jgi:hypothetical protein
VTWRTAFPARRTSFYLAGQARRGGPAGVAGNVFAQIEGRGRTRFQAVLHRPAGAPPIRWVAIAAVSFDNERQGPLATEARVR